MSEAVDEQAPASSSRRARVRALVAVLAVVALNVVTYALLATDTAQRLISSVEDWAYPGAFVLSLLTNLTLAVPVPYNPIIIQLMVAVQLPFLIAVLAAAGSALGESTGAPGRWCGGCSG